MKRILFSRIMMVALIAMSLGLGCALPATTVAQTTTPPEVYKVGVTYSLSGAYAEYAASFARGLYVAMAEINEEGGINGVPISLYWEDTRADPAVGVGAMRKLVSVDKVPVVITTWTAVSMAEALVAEQTKTVLFANCNSPLFSQKNQWCFQEAANGIITGAETAKMAYSELGYRKAVAFYALTDVERMKGEQFKKTFESLGGQVVYYDSYNPTASDFKTQLTKMIATKPDVLGLFDNGTMAAAMIINQARELGLNVQIIGCAGLHSTQTIRQAWAKAGVGTLMMDLYFNSADPDPNVQKFVKRFQAMYPKVDPPWDNAGTYDNLKMVALAIKKYGYSSEGIRKGLTELRDFPGAMGKVYMKDRYVIARYAIYKAKSDGTCDILKVFVPE
jgi:branched-chain amino acid transport system substrate-binding protein